MTHWDRVQSMQLELAQKDAQVRRLIGELEQELSTVVQQRQNVTMLSEEVETLRRHLHDARESRDLARSVAMRLEQENAALAGAVCSLCAQTLVPVPVLGEAT